MPRGKSPASRTAPPSSHRAHSTTAPALSCYFKCENLQRAGAFKFRGAYNAMSRLSADERRRGVVTFSSGNHAQAVALAGRLLDIPRVIVMPSDAPAVKRAGHRRATAAKSSSTIATAKTARTSAAASQTSAGLTADSPLRSCRHHRRPGHGGARAVRGSRDRSTFCSCRAAAADCCPGCAIATRTLSPGCRVVGVEPAAGDDATRSFRTRQLQTVHNPQTVADGARTPSLGSLTFPLVLEYVSDMTTVDDPTLLQTMFLSVGTAEARRRADRRAGRGCGAARRFRVRREADWRYSHWRQRGFLAGSRMAHASMRKRGTRWRCYETEKLARSRPLAFY